MSVLRGKHILVTGGAVRLGAAIAESLAAAGACPLIHYRRSQAPAKALARRLQSQYNVQARVIYSELRTEFQCRSLIERAAATAGRLDGLVNNAAVFHKDPLHATDRGKLDRELGVNLMAPIGLTRAFAETATGGSVVNMLDRRIAGNETGCLPYLLSKKALADFTRIAALELAPRIRVNAVAPGAVLPPPDQPHTRLRDLAGRIPLDIQVTPSDVGEAVVYLFGARALTGQILFVDGGQHLLGT